MRLTVSNYADVQRIGEQILSNFERVNILVNNAGVTCFAWTAG